MRRVVGICVVVLAVVCFVGVGAAHPVTDTDPESGFDQPTDAPTAHSGDEIRQTTTLDRTPERRGEITATVSFELSSRVTELTARLPEDATVTSTNGFSRETDREYAWDERTETPTVTYRVAADRQVDADGPLAEEGQYLFVDTDEWALVRIPSTGARWTRTGGEDDDLAFVRETAIDGPGAAGDRIAFLGEHELETHTAHGQTFRLVVPDAAELDAPVEAIFESLSYASNALRVGERDDEVLVIAAPTDSIEWGVRGLQTGESDMWVQDTEPLDSPLNVWVHEYVHTRQGFQPTAETEWLIEATATYYAALFTLEENRIAFDEFDRYLRTGTDEPQSTAVLSDPSSWQNDADYQKGALVAGELDRQLRMTTDGESSLETVFRSLNSHDGELSASGFERYVADASTTAVGEAAAHYTRTGATPQMWSSDDHAAAFGQTPARFHFALDNDSLIATAPNGSKRTVGLSPTLTVGETLTLTQTVHNVGDTVGSYELPFVVGNQTSTETGRLSPGESVTHEFSHTFDESGSYTITVGDEQLDIRVESVDTDTTDSPVEIETPGFGVAVALLAVVSAVIVASRYRPS